MPGIIQPIITKNGLNSILNKNDKGVSLYLADLTHIEIGDGRKGLNDDSTKLNHKLARISLESKKLSKGYHHVVVVKDTDFDNKASVPCSIYEIGYFKGEMLFAVYSSTEIICEKSSETELILTFNLELAQKQISGDIDSFEKIGTGTETRCVALTNNLKNGDLVYISHENKKIDNIFDIYQEDLLYTQETRYSGSYKIFNCQGNSFDINENFTGNTKAKWKINKFIFKNPHNIPISENKRPLLSGSQIIKIDSQKGFDTVFNNGENSFIPENTTIILSPPKKNSIDWKRRLFNGVDIPPAYILKNSIHLLSNTQIIGFNTNTTLVLKSSDRVHIIMEGTQDKPIKGVELDGWSFDGTIYLNKPKKEIRGVKNGRAFYLDHVENCNLNCKIINHKSSVEGAIFGTETAKYIIANNIYYNEADKGSAAFGCSKSFFRVINSQPISSNEDLQNIVFTDNRDISVNIDLFENDPLQINETQRKISKTTTEEKIQNGIDLSTNKILYDQIKTLKLRII